jgi:imidazolonepropionase-like amidohydrolase
VHKNLILLALVACGPQHVDHRGPRTFQYAVVTSGRPSGSGEVRIAADGTRHSHYTFNDRGRGPDITAELALDERGAPRTLHVTGHGYFGQPVDETLEPRDGKLAWRSTSEHGEAAVGTFYVSLEEALAIPAQLARVCLHARHVKLLPAGEAWIEAALPIEIDHHRLLEVAIGGLGFAPQIVWLDEDEELFAAVSPWISVVRAGAEPLIPEMVAADQKWMAARGEQLAKTLAHHSPTVAITHANVFDAAARAIVPDQTVVVIDDKITAIGPNPAIPAGAQVIDAHGRTLLPGLWDMHVHLTDGDGLLDLASGITNVRDLGNEMSDLTARVKRFDAGTEVGPHVLRAGLIDGPGKLASPAGLLAGTVDEAHAAVARYAEAGYVQIKMYSSLDPALVPVIARDAHDRGMRVSGHIPNKLRASDAVVAGYDEIQHANFLFLQFLAGPDDDTRTPLRFTRVAERAVGLDLDSADVRAFLDLLASHHTVLDPTLVTFEDMFVADPGDVDPALAPYVGRLPAQIERGARSGGLDAKGQRATFRASYAKMLELISRAWKRGITIVAGTDATAGLSLPRELELYVKAGIPAPDVLALATLGAARVMRVDNETGSVAIGKRADLVLVDGDPTRDISAVRNTDVVICRGNVYYPNELFKAVGMRAR